MSLILKHPGGFFSCCSIKLEKIVDFINRYKKVPKQISGKGIFIRYKLKGNRREDITFQYFEHPEHIFNKEYTNDTQLNFRNKYQYREYFNLDFLNLNYLIQKYFYPSKQVRRIKKNIEHKYHLDYSNTCVLFYRGNDKNRETPICGYHEYIQHTQEVLKKNPQTKFLIQSDETQFINFMRKQFPENSFFFKDEIRHMSKRDNTVDKTMKKKNSLFSKYFLAITIIMSQCEHIICGSGNCSLWIILYRGHGNNVYQNLCNNWIVH